MAGTVASTKNYVTLHICLRQCSITKLETHAKEEAELSRSYRATLRANLGLIFDAYNDSIVYIISVTKP